MEPLLDIFTSPTSRNLHSFSAPMDEGSQSKDANLIDLLARSNSFLVKVHAFNEILDPVTNVIESLILLQQGQRD